MFEMFDQGQKKPTEYDFAHAQLSTCQLVTEE